MKHRLHHTFLCLLGLAVAVSTGAVAQQPVVAGNDQTAVTAPPVQGELDALLAPIALYPDQLLAQILMASTYPLQVVQAARFVQQNPSLTGDALDQALRNETWDPSVISLAAYPQVLMMMNDRLDWTQRLGNAFLADQQQVMDTVQMLRSRAQAAGTLQSTPQQTVTDQGGYIDIEPAQPQYVYVPVYDPRVIYGAWWDPAYQPVFWYPPPIYGYPDLSAGIVAGIFFGWPCAISYNHWGWAHPNWRGHDIDIDVHNNYLANRQQYAGRGNGIWTHSPDQRNSLAYGSSRGQGPMMPPNTAAFQAREPSSGRGLPPQQVGARPMPPSQQAIVRALAQPQPSVHAVAQPQRRITPVPQPQPIAHATPQAPRALGRPATPPQPFARALQPSQQSRLLPASQPRPFTHVVQPRQRSVAGSVPRQQEFARAMQPSYQTMARPAPVRQPMARPVPQRSAAQPRYYAPPHAQVRANTSHGAMGRQASSAPNRFVRSRS